MRRFFNGLLWLTRIFQRLARARHQLVQPVRPPGLTTSVNSMSKGPSRSRIAGAAARGGVEPNVVVVEHGAAPVGQQDQVDRGLEDAAVDDVGAAQRPLALTMEGAVG